MLHLLFSKTQSEFFRGPALELAGLRVSLSRDGWLEILSDRKVQPLSFELEVAIGKAESQRLTVRAAPPSRPSA